MRVLLIVSVLMQIVFGIVSNYGEECNFTAECIDHRMICSSGANNMTVCLCDRFHEWRGFKIGCAPKYNVTTIMNMAVFIRDTSEYERHLEEIFLGQKIAGIFVLCICGMSAIAVLLYCIYIRRTDHALKESINRLMNTSKSRPSTHRVEIKHI